MLETIMEIVQRLNKRVMRRLIAAVIGWVVVCAAVPVGFSQAEQTDQVDSCVQKGMLEQKIPGLALAVVRDGRIVKTQGYGLANVELNVPATPETIFQSGSIGKQFTATAVMMLVEEGKIGLDDKITRFFPGAPESWNKITVRNLLSHTSGIKDYSEKDLNFRLDYTEDQLLKQAESFPLDFPPGTDWSYSNTGYMVLGILIHKVTGEFYGDFLQQRIFGPLGMSTARAISEADIIPNRAAGYRLFKGELKNQEYVSTSLNRTGDGGLYFSVLDVAKWDSALTTERLLKRSSLDQMWTVAKLNNGQPNKGNYGFGWFIREVNGHRVIYHAGGWQGFTGIITRAVDDKLTVIILTNLGATLRARPWDIARDVAGLYVPALAPPPPPKAIEDKEPQVAALLKDVLHKFGGGSVDPSVFTREAQKVWSGDQIKAVQGVLLDFGALKSLELLNRKEEKGMRIYRYRAAYEGGPFTFAVHLTSDNKIAELDVDM